jgi:hypothetical protein
MGADEARAVGLLCCENCGREPRDDENAAYEWRVYSDGLGASGWLRSRGSRGRRMRLGQLGADVEGFLQRMWGSEPRGGEVLQPVRSCSRQPGCCRDA